MKVTGVHKASGYSRSQTQQGQSVVGIVDKIQLRPIKRVQSGIPKESPMVKHYWEMCIFRYINTIGVVNLLKCVHSVSYGSSWIFPTEGIKSQSGHRGHTNKICIDCHLLLQLQWRHNGRDSVSNHQPHDCLPDRLFRRRSKKTSKLRVTGLCAGNSPGTGEFPAQMASYAENVSIW